MLKAIAKAVLRIMQDQRGLMSFFIDVLVGLAEDNVYKQMGIQTKEYSKLVKEAKEATGSPHLLAFVGLLTAIIEKGPAAGQANHDAITAYMERVKHLSPTELNERARLCKQAKCYNEQDEKLYLEMGRCPMRRRASTAVAARAAAGGVFATPLSESETEDEPQQSAVPLPKRFHRVPPPADL
jgi:hypothetical protein